MFIKESSVFNLKDFRGLWVALVLCCGLGQVHNVYAQEQTGQEDPAALSLPADSTQAERLLIVGTSWGNNSSFLGRNQAERLPFYTTDLTYISKKGFWLSGLAYQVLNSTSFVDEVDLSAGWSFYLSDRIDASVSYSKFFFSPESELLKASTGNALNAHLGLDWSILYSRISSTVTFGGSTDYFVILDNSRYFGMGKLLHKKDSLTFEPRVSIIAGTQTFVESHLERQAISDFNPVGDGGGGFRPTTPGPAPAPSPGGTTTQQSETTTTDFGILNYELSLPITYSIRNLSFEVVPRYAIPVNQLEGSSLSAQLFVTTSLYYTFRSKNKK